MRIGYLRFNQPLDLDYLHGSLSALNTGVRLGILEGMVTLGHEPVLLSVIRKTHGHILEGRGEGFDYGFMKAVRYEPDRLPKIDLLWIEASSQNDRLAYSKNGRSVSFTSRVGAILQSTSCPVVVHHNEHPSLAFPFGCLGDQFRESDQRNSLRRTFRRVPYAGRLWTVWSHAYNVDAFREACDTARGQYKSLQVPIISTPTGYSPTFDPPQKPAKKTPYDLFYIGHQRRQYGVGRTRKLEKFYTNWPWTVGVVGNWDRYLADDDTADTKYPVKLNGVTFLGPQDGGQGEITRIWRQGRCTLQIADSYYESFGKVTSRFPAAVQAGTLVFGDGAIQGFGDWYLDRQYLFTDRSDVERLVSWALGLTYDDVVAVNEAQRSRLKTWAESLETFFRRFNGEPDEEG